MRRTALPGNPLPAKKDPVPLFSSNSRSLVLEPGASASPPVRFTVTLPFSVTVPGMERMLCVPSPFTVTSYFAPLANVTSPPSVPLPAMVAFAATVMRWFGCSVQSTTNLPAETVTRPVMEQVSISSESIQVPEPSFLNAMRSFVKLPLNTPVPTPSTTRRVPLFPDVPRSTTLPVKVTVVPAVRFQSVRPLSVWDGLITPISDVIVTSFVGSKQ